MADFQELMNILSVPRPNGSPALEETARRLQGWLSERNIPYELQPFRIYPYFFECIGLWLIVTRTLLALAIWLRWGWIVPAIALVSLPGGLVDMILHLPLVTWPGSRIGQNLLLHFSPSNPAQEIILSAHYDSKTELLDHVQRMFFLKSLPVGILLTILLGFLGPVDQALAQQGSPWSPFIYGFGLALSLGLLFLAWGLGLHLSLGRFLQPSQGAVDNGAACAVLLAMAEKLGSSKQSLERTKVTLALFAGEEVNLQGSRAYVRSRSWPLPVKAINLEVLGQDGDYVYWEQDGSIFRLSPTSVSINRALNQVVSEVTGRPARPVGPVISDGASFLAAGIPTTVLGTDDRHWKDQGLHRPSDNLGRVVLSRLPEAVDVLLQLIEKYDRNESSI